MNRPRWLRNRGGVVTLALAGFLASSCLGGGSEDEVLVFAASSLTDTFGDIELAFEAENPNTDVVLNVAGSSSLREQIVQGAPAEVFAAASPETMSQVVDAVETRSSPVTFATNSLVIVVPPGNPAGVVGIESFSDSELVVGICAPGVPCGDAASAVFSRGGVSPNVDTEEPNVRALLSKVIANELDAGLVYQTDALIAGSSVDAIDIPTDDNVEIAYLIAAVGSAAPTSTMADDFVRFVTGPQGQAIFEAHGFGAP